MSQHNALAPMVGATLQAFRVDGDAMQTGSQGPRINVKAKRLQAGNEFFGRRASFDVEFAKAVDQRRAGICPGLCLLVPGTA